MSAGTLTWESAGTDEPGDQNADSAVIPEGGTSAYYSLGPEFEGRWGVELISIRGGEEIAALHLGQHPSEAAAKAAARAHEDSLVNRKDTP